MAKVRVNISGKNLEITQALRGYVEKKTSKLEKYLNDNRTASAEVMLRIERGIHIAEVTMNLSGVLLRGEGKTGDMYTSIDAAVERIERQFNKYKTRFWKKTGTKLGEFKHLFLKVRLQPGGSHQAFCAKAYGCGRSSHADGLLGHDFCLRVLRVE